MSSSPEVAAVVFNGQTQSSFSLGDDGSSEADQFAKADDLWHRFRAASSSKDRSNLCTELLRTAYPPPGASVRPGFQRAHWFDVELMTGALQQASRSCAYAPTQATLWNLSWILQSRSNFREIAAAGSELFNDRVVLVKLLSQKENWQADAGEEWSKLLQQKGWVQLHARTIPAPVVLALLGMFTRVTKKSTGELLFTETEESSLKLEAGLDLKSSEKSFQAFLDFHALQRKHKDELRALELRHKKEREEAMNKMGGRDKFEQLRRPPAK